MRHLPLVAATLVALVIATPVRSQESGSATKYAPNYCLRFRFNCNNAEKKGHVCCLYPLPINNPNLPSQQNRPLPTRNSNIKIRPIRLPSGVQKKKTTEVDDANERKSSRPNHSNRKNNNSNSKKNKAKASAEKTKSPGSHKRPRICQRLVVNCNNSPEHRCCQYEEENPIEVVEPEITETGQAKKEAVVAAQPREAVEVVKPSVGLDELTAPEVKPKPVIKPVTEVKSRPPPQASSPIVANRVDLKSKPAVVVGEAIPVPLEHPKIVEEHKKYEKIINDEAVPILAKVEGEPYNRIPAHCFTETFDCQVTATPKHECCGFFER